MRWIRCFLTIAVFAPFHPLVAQANDSRWIQVDSTRIGKISLDVKSLKREESGTWLAWFLVDRLAVVADTNATDDVTRYDSERWLYRFDCKNQRLVRLERATYLKDKMVGYVDLEHGVMDGEPGFPVLSQWSRPIPGTTLETEMNSVCDRNRRRF